MTHDNITPIIRGKAVLDAWQAGAAYERGAIMARLQSADVIRDAAKTHVNTISPYTHGARWSDFSEEAKKIECDAMAAALAAISKEMGV
jgi:hypothetical protein